jgi:hypothetical protein
MIPQAAKVTASPYLYGSSQPTPQVPQLRQIEKADDNQKPISNTVQDKNYARMHNIAASIGNTVSSFVNEKKQKDHDALTQSIVTVGKAQQNISNAQQILNDPASSDQDKKMAQGVMDQNKKLLDGKLSGPDGKKIQKAFDISIDDPKKNDTPEIKAGQAAVKQLQQATQSGLISDTPQEKALHDKATGQDAGAKQAQQVNQVKQQVQSQNPSATPYADKFLSKQPQEISANPEYARQRKAAEDQEKQINEFIIPKLIQANADREKVLLQQDGLSNRTEYAGILGFQKEAMVLAQKEQEADAKNAMELKKQGMANAGALARTQFRVNALLGAADTKGLTPKAQQALRDKAIQDQQQQVSMAIKTQGDLQTQLSVLESEDAKTSTPELKKKIAGLKAQLSVATLYSTVTQDQLQKLNTKVYGTPTADYTNPVITDTNKGYINVTGQPGSDNTKPPKSFPPATSDADDDSERDEEQQINKLFDALPNQ